MNNFKIKYNISFLVQFAPLILFVFVYFEYNIIALGLQILLILILMPILLLYISKEFSDKKIFESINYNKCNSREYISNIYMQLKSEKYKQLFIKYLENNIKQVSGEWLDPQILIMDNSEETIRLAKLEEKWLGLSR